MAVAKKRMANVNSDINVTPMVDVMLVLLIIFMVITPMLQKGVSVTLAKTDNPIKMPEADKEDSLIVAVMRDGLLQQCDTPQKLYDYPGNMFVAAFIGSPAMNLYEATVGPNAASVKLGSQEIPLPERVLTAHPKLAAFGNKPVVIGMRPEHLPAANLSGLVHDNQRAGNHFALEQKICDS